MRKNKLTRRKRLRLRREAAEEKPDEKKEEKLGRYERVMAALAKGEHPTMRVFGNSMLPLIKTKSKLTFAATNDYQVGDVVMCKVKGRKGNRIIDAHKITKVDGQGRFMIANNRGRENGWATHIFGRVIAVNGEPFGRPLTKTPEQPQG